jgi:septal ring factor EnvC (AmiA/AmiB activator)
MNIPGPTEIDIQIRDLSPAMQRTIEKFRAHVAQLERERVRVAAEQMAGLRDLAQRDQSETP